MTVQIYMRFVTVFRGLPHDDAYIHDKQVKYDRDYESKCATRIVVTVQSGSRYSCNAQRMRVIVQVSQLSIRISIYTAANHPRLRFHDV
jgi:hypothetical protein